MRGRAVSVGCLVASVAGLLSVRADDRAGQKAYRSPYAVEFTFPAKDLVADIESGGRGDPRHESTVPHAEWSSPHVRKRYGSWGPPAKHYAAPERVAGKSLEWKRERVIAVGLRFVGYEYQHHHIPDWHPPEGWPWEKVAAGHNGKGVDCSNFSSFVYNLGFGLKPNSAIKRQSELREVPGPGEGRETRTERVELPESYAERAKVLKTGDLLFIKSRKGEVSHVVLWVGPIGKSPDGTPLILDSHGDGVKDSNGETIPAGVHLRPFREKSWYNGSASHALRLIHSR
jgi:hypothetical protein